MTLNLIIVLISALLIGSYYVYMEWVKTQWDAIDSWVVPQEYRATTPLTVLIPVRNEANNIERCVWSILDCKYPKHLLEIIVINDHSEDETVAILEGIHDDRLILLELRDFIGDKEINAYKKAALQYGIQKAKGELIITTDGDSFVSPQFLEQYASYYSNNKVKMMAGPVSFGTPNNFIEYFQSFDMISMMGITGAGIKTNRYYLANGANLAFNKQAFLSLKPFSMMDTASGDDMFLVQSMAQQFPKQVHFIKSNHIIVTTALESNYNDFWRQRKRWASKSKQYKEHNIKRLMIFIFIVNMCIPISLTIGLLFKLSILIYAGMAIGLLKYWIDITYMKKMAIFFNRSALMNRFYLSFLFYFIYILYTAFVGLFPNKYNWKSRKVN